MRNERALLLELAERDVLLGVTDHKMKANTENLYGVVLSSTEIIHAFALLDPNLEK